MEERKQLNNASCDISGRLNLTNLPLKLPIFWRSHRKNVLNYNTLIQRGEWNSNLSSFCRFNEFFNPKMLFWNSLKCFLLPNLHEARFLWLGLYLGLPYFAYSQNTTISPVHHHCLLQLYVINCLDSVHGVLKKKTYVD